MPTVSFVPDVATAIAMQACISAKACLMEKFDVPSLSTGLTAGINQSVNLDDALSLPGTGADVCLLAAITESFSIAGEVMPTLPPPPAVPDMTDSAQAASDFAAAVADIVNPLGILGSVIHITFDGNGLPTLIEWDVP